MRQNSSRNLEGVKCGGTLEFSFYIGIYNFSMLIIVIAVACLCVCGLRGVEALDKMADLWPFVDQLGEEPLHVLLLAQGLEVVQRARTHH